MSMGQKHRFSKSVFNFRKQNIKMFSRALITFFIVSSYILCAEQLPMQLQFQDIKQNLTAHRDSLLNETLLTFLNKCYNPNCCYQNDEVLCPTYFELVRLLNNTNLNNISKELGELQKPSIHPNPDQFCKEFPEYIPKTVVYEKQVPQSELKIALNNSNRCKDLCFIIDWKFVIEGKPPNYIINPLCSSIVWMSNKLYLSSTQKSLTETQTNNVDKNQSIDEITRKNDISSKVPNGVENANKNNLPITNANREIEKDHPEAPIENEEPNDMKIEIMAEGERGTFTHKANSDTKQAVSSEKIKQKPAPAPPIQVSTNSNVDKVKLKSPPSEGKTDKENVNVVDRIGPTEKQEKQSAAGKISQVTEEKQQKSSNEGFDSKKEPQKQSEQAVEGEQKKQPNQGDGGSIVEITDEQQKQQDQDDASNDLEGSRGDDVYGSKYNKDQQDLYNDDDDSTTNEIFKSNLSYKETAVIENDKQKLHESINENESNNVVSSDPFYEESGSNFFLFFLITMFSCIILYVAYHNKSKILALVIEGRRSQKGKNRRKHLAGYRKLDTNLEEAITSTSSGQVTQIIY